MKEAQNFINGDRVIITLPNGVKLTGTYIHTVNQVTGKEYKRIATVNGCYLAK